MVDYDAQKSASLISWFRSDDKQWPSGAMLAGPSGGKEIVIDRGFEDEVFVARCNDVADASRLCRARAAARDLADQLEAAGVEIERLATDLRVSRTAHAASSVLREQVTAERDYARTAHSQMSDAYDKAVEARQGMEAERDTLRRQLEAAQKAIASWEATCDIYSAASTATHIALGGEMGETLVRAAERVRQQLEAAQLEQYRLRSRSAAGRRRGRSSEMEASETLATAQRRIAELEAGLANGIRHEDKLQKRIRKLETTTVAALTSYAASLEATLRAVVPAYIATSKWFDADESYESQVSNEETGRLRDIMKDALTSATSGLTPDLMAVLERFSASEPPAIDRRIAELKTTLQVVAPVLYAAQGWRCETASVNGKYMHQSQDELAEADLVKAVDAADEALTPDLLAAVARAIKGA
jgi:chromosome segregation ATPase